MFLSCHVRISEWIHTLHLSECQRTPCSKHARYLRLSYCNGTRTHNHLFRKRTLNQLAKLALLASLAKGLSIRLRTKWLWVRISLQSLSFLLIWEDYYLHHKWQRWWWIVFAEWLKGKRQIVQPCLQPRPSSEILTILILRHAASRISICIKPRFWLC